MANQIRLNQLHEEVFSIIAGKGVYDVDIEIPLTSGYYDINTAITAVSSELEPPTFMKFAVSSTETEVWYFELEKPYTMTDYLDADNWVLVLCEDDLPDYFVPTDDGTNWWDTE